MKVLCYNAQAGCGGSKSHFANYFAANIKILDKIAANIKKLNPDVVGLIEVDAGSFRSQNQIKFFVERLGYNYASACKYGWPAGLPVLKHQNLAILTKYEILSVKEHKFSVGFKRLALETVLRVGKQKISFIVTHLSLGKKERDVQLAELLEMAKRIKRPTIIMGDFNSAKVSLSSLTNCVIGKTFPAWKPKQQLDYIFTNAKVKSASVLDWQLSDHLPVCAEIEV